MAKQPVDTSDRPSMQSVECGDRCGEWIVVDRAYTGVGYCTACARRRIGAPTLTPITDPPDHWFSRHNPPPPDPVYPPGRAAAVRVGDPDVSGYCTGHPTSHNLNLMSTDPVDIAVACAVHDHVWHNPHGWILGGVGGANDDICRACAGAKWDSDIGKEVAMEGGPRHDLCLKGRTRGRGANCPCTHDRPYMRGIKPGDHPADVPGALTRIRAAIAAHNPPVPPPPPAAPKPDYLFDPEEDFDG